MRIALLTIDFRPDPGGIATYALETARALARQGHQVLVLAPHQAGDAEFDSVQPFRTRRIPSQPFFMETGMLLALAEETRGGRFDHVLNLTWYPGAIFSWLRGLVEAAPYSIVAYASEIMDDTTSLKRRLKMLLRPLKLAALKNARHVFAISRFTRDRIIGMGADAGRVHVIPCGVDPSRFRPQPPPADLALRCGLAGKKVMLTVGRLDKHKGHETVLRAMAALKPQHPELAYLIVGEGAEGAGLRRLTADLGLGDRVVFYGQAGDDELPALYNLCDIFVMPTRVFPERNDLIEGFGIAYLEAGACGKPVIGGRTGGVADAVEDGVSGLLSEPGDVEDFAGKLERLLLSPGLSEQLGRQGRARVEEHFTWDKTTRRLSEHIGPGAV